MNNIKKNSVKFLKTLLNFCYISAHNITKKFTEFFFFFIRYRSSLPYSKALCKMASEHRLKEYCKDTVPLCYKVFHKNLLLSVKGKGRSYTCFLKCINVVPPPHTTLSAFNKSSTFYVYIDIKS